jgi:uncharacterized membrane protein YsdA (DUF1294 family)
MLWVWLALINIITFFVYRFDKGRAQRTGARRVPEVFLLILLLIGGAVGGAAGMLLRPRHKTRKPIFWIVLLLAVALHGYLLFIWLQA